MPGLEALAGNYFLFEWRVEIDSLLLFGDLQAHGVLLLRTLHSGSTTLQIHRLPFCSTLVPVQVGNR